MTSASDGLAISPSLRWSRSPQDDDGKPRRRQRRETDARPTDPRLDVTLDESERSRGEEPVEAMNGSSLTRKPMKKLTFHRPDRRGRRGARAKNVHVAMSPVVTR